MHWDRLDGAKNFGLRAPTWIKSPVEISYIQILATRSLPPGSSSIKNAPSVVDGYVVEHTVTFVSLQQNLDGAAFVLAARYRRSVDATDDSLPLSSPW